MKKVIPPDAVLVPDQAERVFQGRIYDVYHWPQQMFDGSTATFEMLKRPDTVNVIAIVDGKILVIDDTQPHTGTKRSFPGGRVDPEDGSIESAARREIIEETGYDFNNWRLIRVQQPFSKIEWFAYLVLAWDVKSKTEPKLDAGEKILVEQLSLDEVRDLVINKQGYLADAIEIFENINSLDELLNLPEYTGQIIDR